MKNLINISVLESKEGVLKENMWITAKPLYQIKTIPFNKLHRLTSSDYRQYSQFTFNDGKKNSENWNNDNQNILILDIDDGLTISEARKRFKRYKYFLCTTKSHQIEKKGLKCDRFRIILSAKNIPCGESYFEYMRNLEKLYPFIDKQVNVKTGAFLGCSNATYFYNDGVEFDFNILKPFTLAKIEVKASQSNFNNPTSYENNLPLEDIKNRLTRDTVADVVQSLGYEINSKYMFKYRTEERSPSTSIKQGLNPLIKDFGSDLETDCIGFVQEVKQCDFKTAVEYVGSFTNVQAS